MGLLDAGVCPSDDDFPCVQRTVMGILVTFARSEKQVGNPWHAVALTRRYGFTYFVRATSGIPDCPSYAPFRPAPE